ncbi:MAG: TIGR00730 family Rossman fold protein [Clostridiales bacterium]|nr:TIGR00730 family Rossman fold protein [Clostridiales bacterium]
MRICIYGSASNDIDKEYMTKTEELSIALAKRGHSLVFGGGGQGLMGAAARGFSSQGASIIGVVPKFFNVDGILFDKCDEMIRTDTMRTRKQKMDDLAQGFITTPGGIGTFEEFFEIITLKQLGQSKKPLAVYNINGYFDKLKALLDNCVDGKFMPEHSLELCFFSSSQSEIIDYVENYSSDDFNILKYRSITAEDK